MGGPPPKATAVTNLAVGADVDGVILPAAGGPNIRLMGWRARAGAGAATFNIKNGATGATGTVIAPVALLANEDDGEWFGPMGIDANLGISIDWLTGAPDITIYWASL
jgi:hypothetical protein